LCRRAATAARFHADPPHLVVVVTQRSPINAVLLAAATLALDAVAIVWLKRAGVNSAASYLYDALVSAQLAIVCLWAVFAARHTAWGWIAVIGAVMIATQIEMQLTDESFTEASGTYFLYVLMLAAALWMLKRTSIWQRIIGGETAVWQYSTAVLLIVMTAMAVLIVLVRTSGVLTDAIPTWRLIAILTAGDVLLAVATTMIWARQSSLTIRVATVCAAAILIGFLEISCGISGALGPDLTKVLKQEWPAQFAAYSLMLSLTIFLWLELVPIVSISRRTELAPESQS
jgi:hypothetical protein